MKTLEKSLLATLFLFCSLSPAIAQRTANFESPRYEFKTAMDLFNKEKYGSAQQYFKYVYDNTEDIQQDLKTNSFFYMGVCAAKLNNQDAAFLLHAFIDRYPVHTFVNEARFYLGRYYFSRKQWKKAILQFDELLVNEIQPENIVEYRFKKGYAYFMTGDYDQAKSLFMKARDEQGPYQLRSIYYLAYMAYMDGQYESALEDFLLLKEEPEFKSEVRNFLVQIYFKQGRYEDVLATAPAMKNANDVGQLQILRCVALSQYNLNDYETAANNFDKLLVSDKVEMERNDFFAAGFTYYRVQNYTKAIELFSKSIDDKHPDRMTQNSYYLLADCYLKTNQSVLASQSFRQAAKYDFDKEVKEDALYNYAKLQYEISKSPFNNAIQALEDYINTYPNSTRSNEASSYLSQIYLSTQNYQAAITSIEQLSTKTPDILKAYQRCTYFRSLELINNRKHREALQMLVKTLSSPADKDINLNALYWKGETQYRNEQYRDAYYALQTYQRAANAHNNEFYVESNYSLGYAALKIKRYRDAAEYFKKYLDAAQAKDPAMRADATARLADCYFMQQDLRSAIKYYGQCEQMGEGNADYALYQLSKCYGYQKNNTKKIQALEKFVSNFPKSSYIDDVEYDLAVTYHTQNDYVHAISAYKDFIRKHPKSQYVRQVHTRLAQAYLNSDNSQLAISTYKYVVETYPGSQEAKDALANLENIYTEEGSTGEFFDYVRTKNMNISADRQDSIAFKSAETKYNRGDCQASIKACGDYLRQFPNGSFVAKAHFFKAECEYGQKNYQEALADYEAIIKNYRTEYNVTALHKAASILYNDKEYEKALAYFSKLLESTTEEDELLFANNGSMRCAYFLKKYRQSLNSAMTIVNSTHTDADLLQEALLIAGNSAKETGEFATAKNCYEKLANAGANDLCAEAAFHLADMALNVDRNQNDCETKIQAILGSNYSSEYWYAKTFILYGDLYKERGNYFQARHTYQSIVDNYKGDDLVKEAQEKIAAIDALENNSSSN